MIRLNFDPLASNTFGRLAGVKALIEHSDRSIPEMKQQVQNALKAQAESEGWDYEDYDVARQELEADYQHWVPKYAGYTATVLLWSIVETQMVECAERVAKDRKSPFRVQDIKGSSIDAPVRFIKGLTGVDGSSDRAWTRLKDLQKVRNIIVHRNGAKGEDIQSQKEFDTLILNNGKLGKTTGILPGEELWVSTEFCLEYVAEIEQFFKRLFNKLGLPQQGVTIEA
jgi:hypothetical protein